VERDAAALGLTVAEGRLTLARLRRADAIVLTSALRGPVAGALAGVRPQSGSAPALARLQRRWETAVRASAGPPWTTSRSSSSASSSPSRA
jgi:branched-subunit amino acid aminotransferase/4-amino-4-deoxychorismate lyase